MLKWCALEKGPWSYNICTSEKAVFFLPVNILMVWLPATVCLDIKNYKFKNKVGIQAIKSSETRDERW